MSLYGKATVACNLNFYNRYVTTNNLNDAGTTDPEPGDFDVTVPIYTLLANVSTATSGFLEHKIISGGGSAGLVAGGCLLTDAGYAIVTVKPFVTCGSATADKTPWGGPLSLEWTDPFFIPSYLTSGRGRGGLGSAN